MASPDSFTFTKFLASGSFGEVFAVRHKRTQENFAMKIMAKSRVTCSGKFMRYTMTERNVLSYLRHPYIVSLHYAFQTSNHLVLVMQLCPRGNLQQLIYQERHLKEPLARHYAAEVLLALVHVHARNIIFRDLKPDNVVLDESGHCLLTDFGLAKEGVAGIHGTKSFCGSMAFLSPEILSKQGHGHTVDIYGLGVILFNMLTGMPPYYHPDREVLCYNIKQARLKVPSYVSREGCSLMRALMERDPSKRLGAANTADVQRHIYFSPIDFEALLRMEIPPPIYEAEASERPRKRLPPAEAPPPSSFCPGKDHLGMNSVASRWMPTCFSKLYSRKQHSGAPCGSVAGWDFASPFEDSVMTY